MLFSLYPEAQLSPLPQGPKAAERENSPKTVQLEQHENMLESLVQNCWLFSGREALSVLLPTLPPRELVLCACSQSPGPASTEVGLGVSQFCSMLSSMKNLIFVNVWQDQHCQIKNECQQIFWKSLKSVFFCILHVISRLIYESYLILCLALPCLVFPD